MITHRHPSSSRFSLRPRRLCKQSWLMVASLPLSPATPLASSTTRVGPPIERPSNYIHVANSGQRLNFRGKTGGKRLHCWSQRQRARPLCLSFSRTLERKTRRRHDRAAGEKRGKKKQLRGHFIFVDTRSRGALLARAQRGCNFDGEFSLKQLSIGFPLGPSLPPASTMRLDLVSLSPGRRGVKWPLNGEERREAASAAKHDATFSSCADGEESVTVRGLVRDVVSGTGVEKSRGPFTGP